MSSPPYDAPEILHLDMDCFFAAVEVQDDPALAGRPVLVGGTGPRGVVASASYEARAYGIRSAMPMAEAQRRCPHAVVVAPRHRRYGEVSKALMALLSEVTPLVEPVSLDEAFLDVSGAHRVFGDSATISAHLREEVRARLGLSCSVGAGRSKLVAKLASRRAKPPIPAPGVRPGLGAGVVVVDESAEQEFLYGHLVRAVPGIGPRTAEALSRMGIERVAELAAIEPERLAHRFGRARGIALFELAHGIDRRPIEPDRVTKSIGHEETFDVDVDDDEQLRSTLRRQAESVAAHCRRAGVVGRTVTLKVRYGDFTTITRSHSEKGVLDSGAELAAVALSLFGGLERRVGVRLIGVSLSSLVPAESTGRQLALFDDDAQVATRHVEVERVADEIRRRFGERALAVPPRPLAP